jgi:hypothetical protein
MRLSAPYLRCFILPAELLLDPQEGLAYEFRLETVKVCCFEVLVLCL